MYRNNYFIGIVFFLCFWGLSPNSYAQVDSIAVAYPAINENMFLNTKWKYTYTTHAQSNTVIHKAEEDYRYFLFFKYDNSYQMFLNGKLTEGVWKLNKEQNEVNYPFRNIEWWRIVSFTDEALILEFSLHAKASYRYHFVRVASPDAPFIRSPYELPDIEVSYTVTTPTEESQYLAYLQKRGISYNQTRWERRKARRLQRAERRRKRLEKTERGRKKLKEEEPREWLQIELVGGGFYGGIDPVYRNITIIKTDGRVIKEYQTELSGLKVYKHNVNRDSLERLIQYIVDKKFFDFDKVYTCESPQCIRRMNTKPRPIALRIAVTKGVRRKIITIAMWSGEGRKKSFVNYPPELDDIVRAIQNMAAPPF